MPKLLECNFLYDQPDDMSTTSVNIKTDSAFANGRLAQEMQDFASVKWYRDKPAEPPPLSFPEIHSRLKYIQEQLNYGRCSIDHIAAQRHFQAAESKLQELIERVK